MTDTALSPADIRLETQRRQFCEDVANGIPEVEAAVAVSWTRTKLKKELRDPVFAEMVAIAELRRDGAIEKVAYDKALNGDKEMIKFWLVNRQSERWAERKQVDISGRVQVPIHVTVGVRDGLKALLSETDGAEIAQLQAALHEEIEEAEVISDDG